jgi:5-methylcytosine-specific restriction endonuclease McrA
MATKAGEKNCAVKICSKCIVEKSPAEFHRDSTRKDGLYPNCKQCRTIYSKQYSALNKEQKKKKAAKYYIKNKVKIAIVEKRYREAHKKERAERGKKYDKLHKVEIAIRKKKYEQIHKNEIAIRRREYDQTDKGKESRRKRAHKRRVLKYGGVYELFDPKNVFERDQYTCQLCKQKTKPDLKNHHDSLYPNLDHIIPLSKGGSHTMTNTQCLCHQCNMEKGSNNLLKKVG